VPGEAPAAQNALQSLRKEGTCRRPMKGSMLVRKRDVRRDCWFSGGHMSVEVEVVEVVVGSGSESVVLQELS
jgi:hypothetical protein